MYEKGVPLLVIDRANGCNGCYFDKLRKVCGGKGEHTCHNYNDIVAQFIEMTEDLVPLVVEAKLTGTLK